MKTPKVELDPKYFTIYNGFQFVGVFSAYQLRETFTEEELSFFWGFQVR